MTGPREPYETGASVHPAGDADFDDLLRSGRDAGPAEIREEIARSLGIGGRRATYRDSQPGAHGLADEIGLLDE